MSIIPSRGGLAPSAPRGVVTFRKGGNILEISTDGTAPPPEPIKRLLEQTLYYTQIKHLYGEDRLDPISMVRKKQDFIPKFLCRPDEHGRIVCGFGFLSRVKYMVEQENYAIRYVDKDPPRARPKCYDAHPEHALKHFQFKPRQEECLKAIMRYPCGVVHAITGFGKMVMMAMTILSYPYAKFHIITRSGNLVEKTVDFLTRYIPNVGQIGYGKHRRGHQVTVLTAASLHHSDFDADFILCDEAHELIADNSVGFLTEYRNAKPFAFTASPTGRSDGADIRMEGVFGPTIFYISYQEGVQLGLVVPIRVEWTDVAIDRNPCADMDDTKKKRWGLWQNDARNESIARKARTFGDDDQIMVLVETIEHAVHLRRYLPEYTLVYGANESENIYSYKSSGLIEPDYRALDARTLLNMRREFEQGSLKKVIATGVWSVGIDPCQLTALIRADGSASEIRDIQAPGRVSRTHEASGKEVGIVCDFRDSFDTGYYNRSRKRHKHYGNMGWEQVIQDRAGRFVTAG